MKLRFFLLAFGLFTLPALAGPVSQQEIARATLISEQSVIVPGQAFRVGVRLEAPEGWHTYWENPGDAGLATSLDWTLPEGFSASGIDWPAPKLFHEGPLAVHAYGRDALLPVTISSSAQAAGDIPLKVKAQWLICKDVCIPESAELDLLLMTGQVALPSDEASLFSAHDRARPLALSQPSSYRADGDKLLLSIALPKTFAIQSAHFFPRQPNLIRYAEPQEFSTSQDNVLHLSMKKQEGTLEGEISGVLELVTAQGTGHYEVKANMAAPATSSLAAEQTSHSFFALLLFALLGGLILNLMPCVLPVLSLKALAVVGKKDAERPLMLAQGIAYTLGILVSFAAFALSLILLKSAGEAVGWGYQMQSPAFVGFLIYLLFLVGLNLSGLFEMPVLLGHVGEEATRESSTRGSFLTGVLATAVATPCTAPFMAGAVGAALTLPAWQALLIFEALGLGLALPFLAISVFPSLLHLLPKPGAWMETFRQLLAFPMYASVIWLLWVLTLQTGAGGMAVAAIGMLAIAAALWAKKLFPRESRAWRALALLVICIAALWSLPMLSRMEGQGMMRSGENAHGVNTVAYSPEALEKLRAQKRAVFVDATAAWCITCQVNASTAIHTERTMAAFREKNVTLMIADWTRRDPAITEFLTGFGHQGVPLYVYYPPRGEPAVLPQLLTESAVIEAISR